MLLVYATSSSSSHSHSGKSRSGESRPSKSRSDGSKSHRHRSDGSKPKQSSTSNNMTVEATSVAHFNHTLEKAGDKLVVVDFYTKYCGPNKLITPTLENYAETNPGQVVVIMVTSITFRINCHLKSFKSIKI